MQPVSRKYEKTAERRLWRSGNLAWKLWDQQEPIYYGIRALKSSAVEVVVLCARQFGKSHLGVLLALEDCILFPNSCILIMGPTLKQAREIVTPRLKAIAVDAPPGFVRPSKSEGKWYVGSSELVIGGFDINSTSQRGKTVQRIYIEEVVDSNPDDYTESMRSDLGPALTHSKQGRMIFLSTLPKIPDHPFITDTMARAEMNGALYSYTIKDNKELSPEQYARCVDLAGGETSPDFRREYMNEVIRDPSVVIIPHYSEELHVREMLEPSEANGQVTIDWGGVRDFTVALLHWYDFQLDMFMVWDERWFPENTPTEQMFAPILEMTNGAPEGVRRSDEHGKKLLKWVADLPGQLAVDLASKGYSVTTPPKDDWQAAINALAVTFARQKIVIHPRCRLLRQTLNSGVFNKQRTDFSRTKALGHCDAIAALMYANRTQDRTIPYTFAGLTRERVINPFHRPEPLEKTISDAVVPKIFSNTFEHGSFEIKRFGKFKHQG